MECKWNELARKGLERSDADFNQTLQAWRTVKNITHVFFLNCGDSSFRGESTLQSWIPKVLSQKRYEIDKKFFKIKTTRFLIFRKKTRKNQFKINISSYLCWTIKCLNHNLHSESCELLELLELFETLEQLELRSQSWDNRLYTFIAIWTLMVLTNQWAPSLLGYPPGSKGIPFILIAWG